MSKRIVNLGKTFRCLDLQRVQLVEDFPEEQKYRITLVSGVAVSIPYSLMHIDVFEKMYLEYYDGGVESSSPSEDGWIPNTDKEQVVMEDAEVTNNRQKRFTLAEMLDACNVKAPMPADLVGWINEDNTTHWRLSK